MNKQEFIAALRAELRGLPTQDVEDRVDFYIEMIDDRMEDGLSEDEAVFAIGSVEVIASQIIADIPFSKIAKDKLIPKHRLKAWEIVLLALGSPIWLSLAIAAFAVILSLYVSLWSVIVSFWAAFVSVVACTLGGAVSGIYFITTANTFTGIALIGVVIAAAGLSVFLFFGCKAATDGILLITQKIALGIKKFFIKKENA